VRCAVEPNVGLVLDEAGVVRLSEYDPETHIV
jgi:hypothetical protein